MEEHSDLANRRGGSEGAAVHAAVGIDRDRFLREEAVRGVGVARFSSSADELLGNCNSLVRAKVYAASTQLAKGHRLIHGEALCEMRAIETIRATGVIVPHSSLSPAEVVSTEYKPRHGVSRERSCVAKRDAL
jgi:hypothetical protein